MTKIQVLAIFANADRFLKPDEVLQELRSGLDRRSFYSSILPSRDLREPLGRIEQYKAIQAGHPRWRSEDK